VTHQTSWLENVVCNKTKLVGVLFEKEPNVPLLVVWTKERKVLTSNDAIKRAVKKEMLLIFNRLHRAVATNTLFSRWFGSQPSVSLNPQ